MEWLHFFTGARLNDDKEFDLQIISKNTVLQYNTAYYSVYILYNQKN